MRFLICRDCELHFGKSNASAGRYLGEIYQMLHTQIPVWRVGVSAVRLLPGGFSVSRSMGHAPCVLEIYTAVLTNLAPQVRRSTFFQ